MMHGYLKGQGATIQRRRIRQSLRIADPNGTTERLSTATKRRKYRVCSPNAWHMDGHMKLIRQVLEAALNSELKFKTVGCQF